METLKTLRVAIIGLGNIGYKYDFYNEVFQNTCKTHYSAIRRELTTELTFLVDQTRDGFDSLEKESGLLVLDWKKFISDYYKYDLLVISTPTNTHLEILRKVIVSHEFSYVIVEKPCGASFSDAEKIIELMSIHKKIWSVNYFRSHLPHTLEAKRYLDTKNYNLVGAKIYGYGDLLNTYSHFLHLLATIVGEDALNPVTISSKPSQYQYETSNNIRISLEDIGEYKNSFPILEIYFTEVTLYFMDNGERIVIIDNASHAKIVEFGDPAFEEYQYWANKDYMDRFRRGESENKALILHIHEVICALVSGHERRK